MKNYFFNTKNLLYTIVLVAVTSCGGSNVSEETLETKKILGKLQARTEVGINKDEYDDAIVDLKYAYRQIKNEEEKKAFEKIVKIHNLTHSFWNKCKSATHPYNCTSIGAMKPILTTFPELKKKEKDYGKRFGTSYAWHTDSVINELWIMADNELEKLNIQISNNDF